jgi:hypothetical protein
MLCSVWAMVEKVYENRKVAIQVHSDNLSLGPTA